MNEPATHEAKLKQRSPPLPPKSILLKGWDTTETDIPWCYEMPMINKISISDKLDAHLVQDPIASHGSTTSDDIVEYSWDELCEQEQHDHQLKTPMAMSHHPIMSHLESTMDILPADDSVHNLKPRTSIGHPVLSAEDMEVDCSLLGEGLGSMSPISLQQKWLLLSISTGLQTPSYHMVKVEGINNLQDFHIANSQPYLLLRRNVTTVAIPVTSSSKAMQTLWTWLQGYWIYILLTLKQRRR